MLETMYVLTTRNLRLPVLLESYGFYGEGSRFVTKNDKFEKAYNECKKYELSSLHQMLKGFKGSQELTEEDFIIIAALLSAKLKINRFGSSRVPMAHNIKHYAIDAVALDLKSESIYGTETHSTGKIMFSIFRDLESAIKAYIIEGIDFSNELDAHDRVQFEEIKTELPSHISNLENLDIESFVDLIENKIKEMYELFNMSLVQRDLSLRDLVIEALVLKSLKKSVIQEMQSLQLSEETKSDLHYAVIKLVENGEVGKIDDETQDYCERLLNINTVFAREIVVAIKASEMIAESNLESWRKEIREMLNGKREGKHSFFDFIERNIPVDEQQKAFQIAKIILRTWGSQDNLAKGIIESNIYLAKDKTIVGIEDIGKTLYVLEEIIKNNERQADNYCVPLFYLVYVEVLRKYFSVVKTISLAD